MVRKTIADKLDKVVGLMIRSYKERQLCKTNYEKQLNIVYYAQGDVTGIL